jgi:hypothetical protein
MALRRTKAVNEGAPAGSNPHGRHPTQAAHLAALPSSSHSASIRVAAITPLISSADSKFPLTSYGRKSNVPVYLLPPGLSVTVSIRLNDPVGVRVR